jgi:hypothetical protein
MIRCNAMNEIENQMTSSQRNNKLFKFYYLFEMKCLFNKECFENNKLFEKKIF